MLNHNTWNQYFEFVIITLLAYYIAVFILFFKKDLIAIFSKTELQAEDVHMEDLYQHQQPALQLPQVAPESNYEDVNRDNYMIDTEVLIANLKAAIHSAAVEHYNPALVENKIKEVLHSGEDLANTGFKEGINEFIVTECERMGVALITEYDVDQWW